MERLTDSLYATALMLAVILSAGCRPVGNNPWQTQSYAPPSKYKPVPKSTYAPVPSILPSIEGPDIVPTDAVAKDDLEQVLRELEID